MLMLIVEGPLSVVVARVLVGVGVLNAWKQSTEQSWVWSKVKSQKGLYMQHDMSVNVSIRYTALQRLKARYQSLADHSENISIKWASNEQATRLAVVKDFPCPSSVNPETTPEPKSDIREVSMCGLTYLPPLYVATLRHIKLHHQLLSSALWPLGHRWALLPGKEDYQEQ